MIGTFNFFAIWLSVQFSIEHYQEYHIYFVFTKNSLLISLSVIEITARCPECASYEYTCHIHAISRPALDVPDLINHSLSDILSRDSLGYHRLQWEMLQAKLLRRRRDSDILANLWVGSLFNFQISISSRKIVTISFSILLFECFD